MCYRKFLITGFLLFLGCFGLAQTPFDSILVYNQKEKFGSFYFDLMQHVSSIEIIDEKEYNGIIKSPRKNLKGEATFIYEVADNDSLINVYLTEFWYYSVSAGKITMKDYIVFADGDKLGFDHEEIQQHKLNPTSTELINYLFPYVRKYKKFKVIKPRERNLKYQRVRFE